MQIEEKLAQPRYLGCLEHVLLFYPANSIKELSLETRSFHFLSFSPVFIQEQANEIHLYKLDITRPRRLSLRPLDWPRNIIVI